MIYWQLQEERETEGTIDNRRNTCSREVLDSPGPGISGCQVGRGTEEGCGWNIDMCRKSEGLQPNLYFPKLQVSLPYC